MPYIDPVYREYADPALKAALAKVEHVASGGLNYYITRLVIAWLGESPTYEAFNRAIGVLECAKLELYRRMVAPYETGKAALNGDVYPSSADTEARARAGSV